MRECGGCTSCCKLLGIDELAKPQDEWCKHCNIGVGCKIWHGEGYPPSCKVYQCLWLQQETIPERWRPDKAKAVMGTTVDGNNMAIYARTKTLSDSPVKFRDWVIDIVLAKVSVLIIAGDSRTWFKKKEDE